MGVIMLFVLMLLLIHSTRENSPDSNQGEPNHTNETITGHNKPSKDEGTGNIAENTTPESVKPEPPKSNPIEQNNQTEPEKAASDKPTPADEDNPYAVFNHTLFIGDSRTEGFRLYSGVTNSTYFCLKAMTIDDIIAGKTIKMSGQDLSVYDLLGSDTYDKVIISVGLNELGWNHIETFLQDYGQLIDSVKEKQPGATIYVQAVLPVSREKDAADAVHNNAQIYWYNTNLVQLADSKGAVYFNPAPAVVDSDGFLLDGASTDGIHLNSEYCKKLAAYMANMI